jgi:hypothetical protein
MLADGVELTDQASIDRWIEEFNARPIEERDEMLGRLGPPSNSTDRFADRPR